MQVRVRETIRKIPAKYTRLQLTGIMFLALITSFTIGMFIPLPYDDAIRYADIYNAIVKHFMAREGFMGKVSFILLNNIRVMFIAILPLVGPLFTLYSAFNSGLVMNAVAIVEGKSRMFLYLITLIMPHTWIEFLSYAIVSAESLYVSIQLIKKTPLKDETFYILIVLLVSTGLLIIAAIIEVSSILFIKGSLTKLI